MKILFVCRGNVGRSQIGAAILKTLRPDIETFSAGTKVFDKEGRSKDGQLLKDLPGAEKVILSLKEVNIDVSNNPRNQLTESMVDTADKVIVMAEHETIPPYLGSNPKVIVWEVLDPKNMSFEDTVKIRDQIKNKLIELSKSL